MSSISSEDARRFERNWASKAFKNHNPGHHVWYALSFTQRVHAFKDRVLILWFADKDFEPQIIDQLRVTHVSCCFDHGIKASIEGATVPSMELTHVPQQVGHYHVYAWIPAFSDVRFTPTDWSNASAPRSLRFEIDFRIKSSLIEKEVEPGLHYISTLAHFNKRFPHKAVQL